MVSFLVGLQKDLTKGPCHLCLRDTLNTALHHEASQDQLWGWAHDVKQEPLKRKVLAPPRHIKLGLMKQFVKQLDAEGGASKLSPKLSEVSSKAGGFVGPRVKRLS